MSVCLCTYCLSCLFVCLRVCVRMCVCVSVYLCACLSTCLSVCLCVCQSVCLSVGLSVCLHIYLPACLPACVPICLSVCIPTCCLSVSVSVGSLIFLSSKPCPPCLLLKLSRVKQCVFLDRTCSLACALSCTLCQSLLPLSRCLSSTLIYSPLAPLPFPRPPPVSLPLTSYQNIADEAKDAPSGDAY